jgi:hypothetical protein
VALTYVVVYGGLTRRFRVSSYREIADERSDEVMAFLSDELQCATGGRALEQGALFEHQWRGMLQTRVAGPAVSRQAGVLCREKPGRGGAIILPTPAGRPPGRPDGPVEAKQGATRPAAVNVVFNPQDLHGAYTANFTMVPTGTGGDFSIYSQPINVVAVDYIFDCFGFF